MTAQFAVREIVPSDKLSDREIRGAKPREKGYKLFDGDGLFLYVSPAGGKSWRMQYRVGGRMQTLTIGRYPMIGLADARKAAAVALGKLEKGETPQSDKTRLNGMTLAKAAEKYWAGRQDISSSTIERALSGMERNLGPLWQAPVATIGRAALLDKLAILNESSKFEMVRKVRAWSASVFDWAIEHGECDHNPAREIVARKAFGSRKVKNYARIKQTEIGAFMLRLTMEDPNLLSVIATKLLLYSWVRTGELRSSKPEDVDGDLWRVWNHKRDRMHLVPLSSQAQALVERAKRLQLSTHYLFPNDRRVDRPMSENAVLYLLARMGYGGIQTGHGFRGLGSTWANENGWNADAIERQLAHAPNSKTRAAYNHAEYLPLRREMLQAWADWLDQQEALARATSTRATPVSGG